MKKTRVCDVTGVTRGVRRYQVSVYEIDPLGKRVFDDTNVVSADVDLGKAGLKRLKRFIARGTTGPARGDPDDNGELTAEQRAALEADADTTP